MYKTVPTAEPGDVSPPPPPTIVSIFEAVAPSGKISVDPICASPKPGVLPIPITGVAWLLTIT